MKAFVGALLGVWVAGSPALAGPGADRGTFSIGDRHLEAPHALAVLTDEFFGGKTLAIKVLYSPQPLAEATRKKLLLNDDPPLADSERAYLVLFIDEANHLWQVNLTVVLNGQTVGYTVASNAEELKKFNFSFDGSHLALGSQGAFDNLAWNVATDVPVHRHVTTRK